MKIQETADELLICSAIGMNEPVWYEGYPIPGHIISRNSQQFYLRCLIEQDSENSYSQMKIYKDIEVRRPTLCRRTGRKYPETGKHIYENDVVEWDEHRTFKGCVVFLEEEMIFVVHYEQRGCVIITDFELDHKIRRIGNLHENLDPALIKELQL